MLSQSTTDIDTLPRKTMRRGTHSCLECRQRKVRCVSEPHARKCTGCAVRELPCTDQELHRAESPNSAERRSTRDRLLKLEGMLDQVLRNQSRINEGSDFCESERLGRRHIEPFGGLHIAERGVSATSVRENMSQKRRKVDVLALDNFNADFPNSREIGDEPFLHLFEDLKNGTMRDRNLQGSDQGGHADSSVADKSAHRILRDLRLQIPNSVDLLSILQAGRSIIDLWSAAFPNALGAAESVSPERLRDHIYRCLYSDNITDVTKLMLCLALHFQQLPSDLETMQINLPAPLDYLQEYYMTSAESLLSSDERISGTLDGLECMILQSEFYINMGNLRKVWLIVRRAVNLAQLLGLHLRMNTDPDSRLLMRRNALWTELWQRERGFSLILGLPCSTLESQLPPSISDNNASDSQRMKGFLRDLGIVMGHIIGRDQDLRGKTYSTTLKIEEELEECQSTLSAKWWDFTPDPATPIDVVRNMFATKMRFYTVQRLLHLPFLLKAFSDRRFEGSRSSTLKSSREIIKVYNVLRDEQRPVLKVCDMADFQVFAAAMTLAIDLLARSGTPENTDLQREELDWQLVLQTAGILGRLSRSRKGCEVAGLGARVLEDFAHLRDGPEGVCKVNIPYFGRVEIRRRNTQHNERTSYTPLSSQTSHRAQSQQEPMGTSEDSIGSMVSSDSYLFPLPGASQHLQVAEESWTQMLDLSMVDGWSWFPGGDAD